MRADPSLVLYHILSYAVRFGDSGEESAESGMAAFPKLMSYCSKLSWVRTAGTTGAAWRGVMWCAEGMARQQQLAPSVLLLCWAQQPCLAYFLSK